MTASHAMTRGDHASKRRPRTARIDEEFIKVVAQSMPGLPQMRADVPRAIANDAEYRLRELIQRAKSFMVHSKRRRLTVDDISAAFSRRSNEPVFGFGVGLPVQRIEGVPGVYMRKERFIELEELIKAELPLRGPLPNVEANWIALGGNELMGLENTKGRAECEGLPDSIRKEFDIFAEAITDVINDAEADDADLDDVMREIATRKSLHPVLPTLTGTIRNSVYENARVSGRTEILFNVTRLIYAMLCRNQFGIEAYYDQLLPPLLTCLLGRRLGRGDHWLLRDYAASIVHETFQMHTDPVARGRTAKTMVAVLTDKHAPLESVYGAIRGLAALGQDVFRMQFLPHLPALLLGLERAAVANDKLEGEDRAVVDEKISLVCHAIEETASFGDRGDMNGTHLMDTTL